MTIICQDTKTLASDTARICSNNSITWTCQKIHVFNIHDMEVVLTGCGSVNILQYMIQRISTSIARQKFPTWESEEDADNSASVMCLFDGYWYEFFSETHGYVDKLPMSEKWTSGSGLSVANGAMEMGADAIRAVEIFCQKVNECKLPIQYWRAGWALPKQSIRGVKK